MNLYIVDNMKDENEVHRVYQYFNIQVYRVSKYFSIIKITRCLKILTSRKLTLSGYKKKFKTILFFLVAV